ncbi:hypothetical protein [Clostridium cylindrosporum]|uniref:SbsC C-terminal domain-containing protein n=1 Tax=Clostridium cylindrosporum DSM 605 TaxID=1121307 RepID=A0A0J8DB20_CLOCY|nr:hypothetical protein [Clostridium cylindrosporum]KMT23022.1 hypothetical protein CLCY_7c00690 [Clostridium cylindrosporum DSM 605]
MKRIKSKLLGVIVATFVVSTSISLLVNDISIAYATTYPSESKVLKDAKAKINHLTKSLKTNYLGIKNQAMWQTYIGEARELIKKIPNSEKAQKDALAVEVNKDEALVNGLARVNQVEKSTTPKDKGGYGNSLIIKNAETWNEYLRIAKIDLEKVDKSIFKKQYDELIGRLDNVSKIVKDIEDKFQIEYDRVVKLYEEAKSSNDLDKAKNALAEAEKLGTCDRSDKLEKDIKAIIVSRKENKVIGNLESFYKTLPSIEVAYFKDAISKVDVDIIEVASNYILLKPNKNIPVDYITLGWESTKGKYIRDTLTDRKEKDLDEFSNLTSTISKIFYGDRDFVGAYSNASKSLIKYCNDNESKIRSSKDGLVRFDAYDVNGFTAMYSIYKFDNRLTYMITIYEKTTI